MAWFFEGNGSAVTLGVSESGFLEINGTAQSHEPKPAGGDSDLKFFRKLAQVECVWSISPSDAPEIQIDPSGDGFFKLVRNDPDKTHAAIHCFREPESVGVSVVLPPKTFQSVWDLCKLLLREPALTYVVSLDFIGFRVETTSTDTPTIKEFLNGKPYFSSEASFSIRRNESRA